MPNIAARTLALKDCRMADRRIVKMTRVRLRHPFGRLERRRITRTARRGNNVSGLLTSLRPGYNRLYQPLLLQERHYARDLVL
jgi:hypothetical protein